MSRLQPARGTFDLLPDAMAAHHRVVSTARGTAGLYGFQEMATPIFEFAEVFSVRPSHCVRKTPLALYGR